MGRGSGELVINGGRVSVRINKFVPKSLTSKLKGSLDSKEEIRRITYATTEGWHGVRCFVEALLKFY